jgi:hypothetical protein
LTISSDLSEDRCLAVLSGRAPFFYTRESACAIILAPRRSVRQVLSTTCSDLSEDRCLTFSFRPSTLLLHERPCACDHFGSSARADIPSGEHRSQHSIGGVRKPPL